MKELKPGGGQRGLVITGLLAQVYDCADAVLAGKLGCPLNREPAANGDIVRQPVEVGPPSGIVRS